MLTRYVVIGLFVVGCGKPDPTQRAAEPAAKTDPATTTPPAPAPPAPAPPAPAPLLAEPPPRPSNAPKDNVVHVATAADMTEIERAIAPYSAQAKKTYPDAKRRYLAGLPPGHVFSVLTTLRGAGGQETVFVVVNSIKGDQITGVIDSNVVGDVGHKGGDPYTLSERDLVDWMILRPDGTEEGNLVGKFLDDWNAKPHH